MEVTPTTKNSIFEGLAESFHIVVQSLTGLSDEQFQLAFPDKWSIAEQLDHLLKSNRAILKGLHLPKAKLLELFGRINRSPHNFSSLKALYLQTLQETGLKATPPFQPGLGPEYKHQQALEEWKNTGEAFQQTAALWTEEELDDYALMHPAVGLLSIREMLFFTIYHNAHHLLQIEAIKEEFIH